MALLSGGCAWPGGLRSAEVPSAAGAEGARLTPAEVIETRYGASLKQVRLTADTADNLTLAQTMVRAAKTGSDPIAVRLELWRQAATLAVEDVGGASTADQAAAEQVRLAPSESQTIWRSLVQATQAALRRRNLRSNDPGFEPYLRWRLNWAQAAQAADNQAVAQRVLEDTIAEAKAGGQWYTAFESQERLGRLRYEWPFQRLARKALARLSDRREDRALNLEVGEAVVAQIGDPPAVAGVLLAADDATWKVVATVQTHLAPAPLPADAAEWDRQRAAAKTAEAALPPAADLITAAKHLEFLAQAANRPSPIGRAYLLRTAAALWRLAGQANTMGLRAEDKLALGTHPTEAERAAREAEAVVWDSRARAAGIAWVALSAGDLATDWTVHGNDQTWSQPTPGELGGKGNWGQGLWSRQASPGNFVLLGEFLRLTGDFPTATVVFHGQPNGDGQRLEFNGGQVRWGYMQGGDVRREIARANRYVPPERWTHFRLAVEGARCRVWLEEELVLDARDSVDTPPRTGGLGIEATKGEVHFRELRLHDLR